MTKENFNFYFENPLFSRKLMDNGTLGTNEQ